MEAFGYPLSSGSRSKRQLHHRKRDRARRDWRRQPVLSDFRAGPAGRLRRSAPRRERQSHRRRLVEFNFLSEIRNTGDIPQNVNFAIKASVVANFLQDNAIRFQIGEATRPMKGPDLADEAKALSAFIVCR